VGSHQYPPGCCVGIQDGPISEEPTIQRNVPITEKHVELKNVQMSQLEFEMGGSPPISTSINPPPLGINGLHCIECPEKRGKCFMNLNLGD
jgi:hypothetical protein